MRARSDSIGAPKRRGSAAQEHPWRKVEDFRSRRAPRGRAELHPLARAPSVLRAISTIPGRLAPVRPASLHPGREARPAPAAARTRPGGRVSPVGLPLRDRSRHPVHAPPKSHDRSLPPAGGDTSCDLGVQQAACRATSASAQGAARRRSLPALPEVTRPRSTADPARSTPANPVNPVEKGSASGHDTPPAPRRGRTIGRSRRSQARVRATSTVTRRRVSRPRRPIHGAAQRGTTAADSRVERRPPADVDRRLPRAAPRSTSSQ